jgi:hypothetical protein
VRDFKFYVDRKVGCGAGGVEHMLLEWIQRWETPLLDCVPYTLGSPNTWDEDPFLRALTPESEKHTSVLICTSNSRGSWPSP